MWDIKRGGVQQRLEESTGYFASEMMGEKKRGCRTPIIRNIMGPGMYNQPSTI
jgi:hypothetical protein